jgi:CRISPR-associated protein Cas2
MDLHRYLFTFNSIIMNYFLICYDISSDKARNTIAKRLRQMGFRRLQKSVFIGKIKTQASNTLLPKLQKIIDLNLDSLCVIPLTHSIVLQIENLGQQHDFAPWLTVPNPTSQFL